MENSHPRGHYQITASYVEDLQIELAQCRSLLATRDAELVQLKSDHSQLRAHYKGYRQAHESLQLENNDLSRELESTTNLSIARGKELATAQVFLSKADNISMKDLRDLVDELNEEIFQTSASLGDCVVRRKYELSDEDQRLCTKRLRPIMGKEFLQILSIRNMKDPNRRINSLLVQVAVQVLLIDRCKFEVDQWDPDEFRLSDALTRLYDRMRASELQSVCGRWRALTLAQIKPDMESWRNDVFEIFGLLTRFAGWETRSVSHLDTFRNRLGLIYKIVQQVRRAIGQDIVSEDHKLYTVPPDKPFRTVGMEEAYCDREKHSPREAGIVLGTTALGLQRVPIEGHVNSEHCILMPKVVVNTTFRDVLAIQASQKSTSSLDGRD